MWFRILVLALGTFALGTDGFVIAGILPDIAHQLNISVDLAGQLVTVFSLTYALGSPMLAALAGNIPRRRLLLMSLAFFVAANLLAAVATSFAVLLVARILAAGGAALYTPTAAAAAASLVPAEKRGRALSLVTAGMTLSLVLGVPLGIFIGSQFNWQMTFVLIAVLSAIAFVGVLMLFPTIANPPTVALRTRLALLRRPALLLTLLTTTFGMIGAFTVYTYLGPLLQQITHLNGAGISGMFLLFGLASMLGNVIGGYSADRWGTVRTVVLGVLLLGLALFMLPFAATLFLGAALAIAVWGVAGWMLTPPQQSRLIAQAPDVPGVVLSLNGSAIYLGSATGAALGGVVLHFAPIAVLGWVGSAWELIALGAVLWSAYLVSKASQRSAQEKCVVGAVCPAQEIESTSVA